MKITRRELFVGSIFIAYLGHEARAETSLSDSEAAKVAAAALAAHTWILIPLGTPFPTYVQGDNLLLVNTAQKANLVKVDHNGLGGLTISPTPDGTKFVFGNNIELHIPLGTDKVLSIVKNEPIAGKMAEYRVLMGTYIIIFGTDYQKFLQTYKEVTNNTQAVLVNPDGKFQMLIKLDPFTSTWTFSVMDTALLNQDFSTHAVNDKLAQIRMGFEN